MKTRSTLLTSLCLVVSLFFFSTTQAQSTPTKDKVEKEFKVPKKILESYVGTYSFENDIEARVSLKDGKLYGEQVGSGQDPLPLFAITKTTFEIKAMGAEIVFSVNDEGKVIGMTFFQQEQEMYATKN